MIGPTLVMEGMKEKVVEPVRARARPAAQPRVVSAVRQSDF